MVKEVTSFTALCNRLDALDRNDPNWKYQAAELFDRLAESEQKAEDPSGCWDFHAERALDVLASDGTVCVRPIREGDKDFFNAVRMQWSSPIRLMGEELPKTPHYWPETQKWRSFYCISERLADHMPLGYIAIKDTRKGLWELAFEFDKQHCHQGYGGPSIGLFLREIERRTGVSQYQARVYPDNIPCQKCLEKIGAILAGICDGDILKTEESKKFCEEHMLDSIDDHMRLLAERIHVPARKLLSNVLDYRLYPSDFHIFSGY